MNLVGKIFVVLILVASTVFMTLGLMVYATHRNWYEEIMGKGAGSMQAGWKVRLDQAREQAVKLRQDIEKLNTTLTAEKANHLQAIVKAENQLNILKASEDQLTKQVAEKTVQLEKATKGLQVAQDNLTSLRKENTDLREDIRVTYKQVDDQLKKATQMEDKLHIALLQLTDLKARGTQMALQLANARALLTSVGMNLETRLNRQPGNVRGQVLAVDKDDRAEVSLGTDDGLLEGNTLEIYRGNRYLGRLQILEAHPHRAIGMILKDYKQDVIRTGDEVATQLKA